MNALMWSCPIEIPDVGTQDPMQLLFTEDQYVIQALSPNTPQKAFTDGIGTRRVIRCFKYLDTARCCHASETGTKLAIVIANEILRRVSIGSRLSQLLCGPSVSRRPCHTNVDHAAGLEFDDEECKERAKKQIGHRQEIAGPHVLCMIAQKRRPDLSCWRRSAFSATSSDFGLIRSASVSSSSELFDGLVQCEKSCRSK